MAQLSRFHIRVNHGDKDITVQYYFVHKNYATMSEKEQTKAFDEAVKELDFIYKTYGRFATQTGVERFFKHHGFERTIP